MIKPRVISQLLAQANTGGVHSTLLLNLNGSLLAFAGGDDRFAKIIAAVVTNIWSTYQKNTCVEAESASAPGQLQTLLLECEEGRVALTRVDKLLLCLVGSNETEFGILRMKANALRSHMEEPLSQIAV
ncbi:uncharacterized protein BJ171DRAFT_509153 [Polychytrium aggregatum]|uniref:uncharacterized protein n=1 Tax=Polychytrium aggregatum TaxID=110093 RepID=UPI0022FF0469|nr:uncharacterized protein BJ171DRAFT_509153 [Polychytrium aggregatum]KAI9203638.1 hypothetical protein BJ171DRAFT_509153 [Polychytrium aggregatum]